MPHGDKAYRKSLLTDLVSVHLVDSHLGALAVHKLHKSTSLARWNLDVSNISKHSKAVPELVLVTNSRETANKDSGVVGVVVLVRGVLRTARLHSREAISCGGHTHVIVVVNVHVAHAAHATYGHVASVRVVHVAVVIVVHAHLVLGCGHRDADGAAATIDALHLVKGTHLLTLVSESNKSIA